MLDNLFGVRFEVVARRPVVIDAPSERVGACQRFRQHHAVMMNSRDELGTVAERPKTLAAGGRKLGLPQRLDCQWLVASAHPDVDGANLGGRDARRRRQARRLISGRLP